MPNCRYLRLKKALGSVWKSKWENYSELKGVKFLILCYDLELRTLSLYDPKVILYELYSYGLFGCLY